MTQHESRSKQPDEPSVDEILASIRQIVFENDDRGLAPKAGASKAEIHAAEVAAADDPAARAGRADPEPTTHPAETDAPADEPPQTEEMAAGEVRGAAETDPPEGPELPEPPESAPESAPAVGEAAGIGAGPGDTVLLLTEMIAPDGSVVRIDPRPAEAPPPDTPRDMPRDTPPDGPGTAGTDAGAGDRERAGEGELDLATQVDLAATVREWLDRNAPGMVDRAARSEVQKLAERQD